MTDRDQSTSMKRLRRVRTVVLGAIVLAGTVVSIEVAIAQMLGDCGEARREAIADDRISAEWGPRVADRMVQRARAEMAAGNLEEAERKLNVALEWNPVDAGALATLSELRFEQGEYARAAKFASEAVKNAPERADYRVLLGDAYYKSGRYEHAQVQYVLASDLGDPRAFNRIERVQSRLAD
jgi:tetratricopeptide (TPR) repeat protein